MQNKPTPNNRDDIKVVITALALTLTLAFWNLFSDGLKKPAQGTSNVQPLETPTQLVPVKILMGGPPPKTTIFVSQPGVSQPRSQRQQVPQPVTNTSSSR